LKNALQRRPARAKSAAMFLDYTIPHMKEAIKSKNNVIFRGSFQALQSECRNCHIKEDVSFIQIAIPEVRLSPVKFQKNENNQ
jgi:plasmid rolling circle replication initiator protein Rep